MKINVKRILECFPYLTQETAKLIYEKTRLKDSKCEDYMRALHEIADILDMPVKHVTFEKRQVTYHLVSTGDAYESTIMLNLAGNPHFLIGNWGSMAESWD